MADVKERDQVKPQTAPEATQGDQFDRDLHPNRMAGQNIGAVGAHDEQRARTARDVKAVHARLRDWSDADLDQVPILPSGSRLEQDATYLELRDGSPREFTATGDMTVQPGQCLIAKSGVPYQLWNRLRGVTDPARTS
jgi:hypothetical protein